MSLHEAAVLVKLTIRSWDGFKKDKKVSEKVDADFQTAGRAGNYNKRLLSQGMLAPVASVIARIRSTHNTLTMPWQYDGVALLPNRHFFKYREQMATHIDEFNAAVDNLVVQYPVHKANQARALGALFDPEQYPSPEQLRAKYEVNTRVFPVPSANHFVIDLEEHEAAKLKAEFAKGMIETNKEIKLGLYTRVREQAAHAYERLADPGHIFRDSLAGNLELMAEILPGLNVFEDPVLDVAAGRIKSDILLAPPQRLRDDLALRAKASEGALDLMTFLDQQITQLMRGT